MPYTRNVFVMSSVSDLRFLVSNAEIAAAVLDPWKGSYPSVNNSSTISSTAAASIFTELILCYAGVKKLPDVTLKPMSDSFKAEAHIAIRFSFILPFLFSRDCFSFMFTGLGSCRGVFILVLLYNSNSIYLHIKISF